MKKNNLPQRILIFGFPRTGTTTLRDIIDKHPEVKRKMGGEVFNKDFYFGIFSSFKPSFDIENGKDLTEILDEIDKRFSGFKHLSYQLEQSKNEELLSSGRYKIIFLRRKNLLKRLVSENISQQAQYWLGNRERILKHDFHEISLEKTKKELIKDQTEQEHYYNYLKKNKIDFFDLKYEDLYEENLSEEQKFVVLNKIFKFLGFNPVSAKKNKKICHLLDPEKNKLNNLETYSKIPNIDQINQAFGSQYGFLYSPLIKLNRPKAKKILVISPEPSHPQNAGNRARIYKMLDLIKNKLGYEVHFVYDYRPSSHGHVKRRPDYLAMQNEWNKFYSSPFGLMFLFDHLMTHFWVVKKILKYNFFTNNFWRVKNLFRYNILTSNLWKVSNLLKYNFVSSNLWKVSNLLKYNFVSSRWWKIKNFLLYNKFTQYIRYNRISSQFWRVKNLFRYNIVTSNFWRIGKIYNFFISKFYMFLGLVGIFLKKRNYKLYLFLKKYTPTERKETSLKKKEGKNDNVENTEESLRKEIYKVTEIDKWYDFNLDKFIRHLLKKEKYHAVIVEYVFMSRSLLNFIEENTLKIIDTHDVFTDRNLQFQNKGIIENFFSTTAEEEARGINRADRIIAIQEEEKDKLTKLTKKPIYTIGHTIDTEKNMKQNFSYSIGYIGAKNVANEHALNYFIDKIFPSIEQEIHNIKLLVAGKVCSAIDNKKIEERNIKLLDELEDIYDFYNQVDLTINPVFVGTGLKIKTIESLGMGIPVITTSIGADGIKDANNRGLFIVEKDEDYLKFLKRIFDDFEGYKNLSTKANLYSEEYNRKITEEIKKLLE